MKFSMLFADVHGDIKICSELTALGRSGNTLWQPKIEEMLPLPAGADLMLLPGCHPVGMNEITKEVESLTEDETGQVSAVAAIMPMGYTRLLLPAWERENPTLLPLYGYTMVAAGEDGRLYVAAMDTEFSPKWDPHQYPQSLIQNLIPLRAKEFPNNRILKQLAYCSTEYHCLTAQNIIFRRWEAGMPTSSYCNAGCLGCISEQPSDCCPSPQRRIDFTPTVREIVELSTAHLAEAEEAIISFGQGCEGEPLTTGKILVDAVRQIRSQTSRGTININTNAGLSRRMAELVEAGLNSARISLISAVQEDYTLYHRPVGYDLCNVKESLRVCRKSGVFTSLNLLVFPGYTDLPEQWHYLRDMLSEGIVQRIQLRNLNIDPEYFFDHMNLSDTENEAMGISEWLTQLKREFPEISIGSFSHPI